MEQKKILLEIKLPKEVTKSPRAMEIILGAFHQPSTGNIFDAYLKGKTRTWFSLEIISIGGEVHFLIWVPEKSRNVIESQIYSQFPQMEIFEAPDYSLDVVYNPSETSFWGAALREEVLEFELPVRELLVLVAIAQFLQ